MFEKHDLPHGVYHIGQCIAEYLQQCRQSGCRKHFKAQIGPKTAGGVSWIGSDKNRPSKSLKMPIYCCGSLMKNRTIMESKNL